MSTEHEFLGEIEQCLRAPEGYAHALERAIAHFRAESGTIHLLEADGLLHLTAASRGIPEVVLAAVRTVPVGKGMAGLAVQRKAPVNACNIQTDSSGDVRPGAKATGLQGALVVPILRGEQAVGALGIGQRSERVFDAAEQALLTEVGRRIAAHRAAL